MQCLSGLPEQNTTDWTEGLKQQNLFLILLEARSQNQGVSRLGLFRPSWLADGCLLAVSSCDLTLSTSIPGVSWLCSNFLFL